MENFNTITIDYFLRFYIDLILKMIKFELC